ncbi:lysozyme inhibitor LprI family protein [Pseudomonas sp. Seg1]|uniref:lysozyme inhibitor LprI family protein n=1 Tax=Pseudomonas sp. Seg1 TaxID=2678259 RepID=UPI0020177AFC|nr:lysozyme inhibitor LprI family protein [Pseudomonas sp. Seg1]
MNRIIRFIALLLGMLCASIAYAEGECKVISSSLEFNQCVAVELKRADAKLNASYKKLMARFEIQQRRDPEQGKAFMAIARESQRAWIKLRDTTCPLEATDIDPDTALHSTIVDSCITRMSLERTAYLDGIVADGSGDVVDMNKVSRSGAKRYQDVVARYLYSFDNPCLTVQILAPDGGWRVLSSAQFCSFDGKSFQSGYADAGFEKPVFADDGLHLTLSTTELRAPGEKRRACVIPIKNAQIKELKCGAPESS